MREAKVSDASQECIHCRTVLSSGAPFCIACGSKDLRARSHSRFPYDAMAAFLGVIVVIIYWLGR
jgi:ribosomal protein L40E